jgi:hypothetical protein
VFLDYDGTLSPIVDVPDEAFMTDAMRAALLNLSSRFVTAIVTGRSTEKVYNFVRLDSLVYAGSHGFDIKGTPARPISCQVADHMRPVLEQCLADLQRQIADIRGAELEDNGLAVSVHYRHVRTPPSVAPSEWGSAVLTVDACLAALMGCTGRAGAAGRGGAHRGRLRGAAADAGQEARQEGLRAASSGTSLAALSPPLAGCSRGAGMDPTRWTGTRAAPSCTSCRRSG